MARRRKRFRGAEALQRFTRNRLTSVSRMKDRVSDAFARGVEAGYDPSGEDEPGPGGGDKTGKWGYRRTRRKHTRDVANISYPNAVELVWTQYCGNPLAKRLNELRRDQVVDTGIRPKATEPDVQEVIDAFWDDPVNMMGVFCYQFGLQIGIFGTQTFPAFTSIEQSEADDSVTGSGLVRLGYLDPGQIKDIVLDPDNVRIPIAVVEDLGVGGERVYRVIHVDDDAGSETHGLLIGVRRRQTESARRAVREAAGDDRGDIVWVVHEHGVPNREQPAGKGCRAVRASEAGANTQMTPIERRAEQAGQSGGYQWEDEDGIPYDGCCFLFRVNHLMNGRYGWPDTLHLVDWLDQADMFFFDIAERIFFLTLFIWDVLMEGLEQDEIDAIISTMPTPKRGAIRGHNESVTWKAESPALGQADMEIAARVLLWWIGGIGFGVPEAWLGVAQMSRYAGAVEAVVPARKILEARQEYIRSCIRTMVQFQIDQATIAKHLSEEIDTSFTVEMPEVSKSDVADLATTFKTVAEGLVIGIVGGLVSVPTGIKVIHKIIGAMGIDVDPAEMEGMSPEEKREARELYRLLQQLEQVELGAPLKLKDLYDGSEVTAEDVERVRQAFPELLHDAGIEEEP